MHTADIVDGPELVSSAQIIQSPVGLLLLRASAGTLIELSFHRPRKPDALGAGNEQDRRVVNAARVQLDQYFAGKRTRFDVPLHLRGPAFHRRVWELLLEIPYGHTVSYGWMAARLGDAALARAVGTANGANPIAIIVPCHRVIGSDGSLVGYGGGLRRKQALLDLESGSVGLGL